MKSFTLISGILITLLGVFFFANPTNLLAIVGWLFALDAGIWCFKSHGLF